MASMTVADIVSKVGEEHIPFNLNAIAAELYPVRFEL
jgi:hypothetical protein